jgi:copper chaperone NosL
MKQQLSITSRILTAFASGALIAVFFLPVWRIDLFAPQYSEGLTMYIWINKLTGQVDVINGLNHYIGMKHISEEMFPEFKVIPFIVVFFMALGMVVAITGKRKYLFWYLVLTAVGGVVAMVDFYRWGYQYGHNLDPTAPIQIPGFSYQPPLFGHKRILNFDAYSFPEVGGWIVIAAGALAFVVWFVERYHDRTIKKKSLKLAVPAVAVLLLFLTSCSSGPEPFKLGSDICQGCKMGIADPKFGGEIVTKKGKVYKFDDAICMVRFLKSGAVQESEIKNSVVINFQKTNDFIKAEQGFFYEDTGLKSPMGGNVAAFANKQAAENYANSKDGRIIGWDEVYKKLQ